MPALLLATNVYAANKGSLHISALESVAEKQLPAGDYTVQWEDAGSTVQLRIRQGGKLMASAPAKILILDNAPTNNSTVVSINDDGSRRLRQIYFSGKKFAIEIEEDFDTASVHGSN